MRCKNILKKFGIRNYAGRDREGTRESGSGVGVGVGTLGTTAFIPYPYNLGAELP